MKHQGQQRFTWLLAASLLLNLFFLAFSLFVIQEKGGLPWLERQIDNVFSSPGIANGMRYGDLREDIFHSLPIQDNDIVFAGDSIPDYGEWHELLGMLQVKNRAIAGSNTTAVLRRLDGIVSSTAPAHLVLEVGINDLQQGRGVEQIQREYSAIVEGFLSISANSHMWLLPLFPVNQDMYRRLFLPNHFGAAMPQQANVDALNVFLRQLAAKSGPRVHFVNVPEVLDSSGALRREDTSDGIHLNGHGLAKIAQRLKAVLPAVKHPDSKASL